MAHATQMSAADTGLLVIDVQEKLMPRILDADRIVANIAFLVDTARLLNMPVQCTEQYPRGLGATVSELAQKLPERPDKVAFSSCAVPAIVQTFHREARPKVVLCGIEAHVCVLHTALDLLALDFRVYVVADAVGSRYRISITTSHCAVWNERARFDLQRNVCVRVDRRLAHPQFKAVSQLIQQRMKFLGERPA